MFTNNRTKYIQLVILQSFIITESKSLQKQTFSR